MSAVEISRDGPSLLDGYRSVMCEGTLETLAGLARRLRGHRIAMVNSTATGGGVAEILHRLVRLLDELGVPVSWEVMPGDARFYGITKTVHNALHGWPGALDDDDRAYYLEANRRAAQELALDGDLVLIHDPQPAALAGLRRSGGQRWVWRCHIDLSRADQAVWEFLSPHVGRYDAAVFSHADFVPPLGIPGYLAPPSIDPLSDKNRELPEEEIDALLARRREKAHLVLAGGSADDDPEGAEVLAEVRARAGGRSDISVLLLPPDAHLIVNALQRRSTVVVQKSLREGFALTVSEALWKRRAVVAGAVGGIPLQVIHERTGLLVRSVEGCAYQLIRLLRNAALRRRLGREGREHVRDNFLHPREARDYLAIFTHLLRNGNGGNGG